eukprot:TRINITY_DN4705_c0_g1_i4.p2 TRINITY_DN4705_c0_g1~~TRINITY_DN4705_c0_g1_i4.p2  ORF type:complete len:102 (+),score=5.22 TRINITY_DN4705_c0_g1_i4:354-659(+)
MHEYATSLEHGTWSLTAVIKDCLHEARVRRCIRQCASGNVSESSAATNHRADGGNSCNWHQLCSRLRACGTCKGGTCPVNAALLADFVATPQTSARIQLLP